MFEKTERFDCFSVCNGIRILWWSFRTHCIYNQNIRARFQFVGVNEIWSYVWESNYLPTWIYYFITDGFSRYLCSSLFAALIYTMLLVSTLFLHFIYFFLLFIVVNIWFAVVPRLYLYLCVCLLSCFVVIVFFYAYFSFNVKYDVGKELVGSCEIHISGYIET